MLENITSIYFPIGYVNTYPVETAWHFTVYKRVLYVLAIEVASGPCIIYNKEGV